jgi:thiamine-phosphate pyrophosphorylase
LDFILPKIYPITDARLSGLSHAAQVEKLIAGGATLIQLREKHAPPRAFYEDAEQALAIARGHGVKIIINDRVDIALALDADGVHLGQDDLPPSHARKILGPRAIIGFSTHSTEQALRFAHLPIDYIAFGPIFATKTKENPDETVGLDGIKSMREPIGGFPLVAIGGINSGNVSQVIQAGAVSAAVISCLYAVPDDIAAKMAALLKIAGS